MNARDIAVAAVALVLGCLGPTAALIAGMQGSCGAAPIVVGALIAAALLGSAGVVLCRDDEGQASESQLWPSGHRLLVIDEDESRRKGSALAAALLLSLLTW